MNHFYEDSFITSKASLTIRLKNCHHHTSKVVSDDFYPKSFVVDGQEIESEQAPPEEEEDGVQTTHLQEFKETYRLIYAQGILKKFVDAMKEEPHMLPQVYTALNILEK